MFQGKAVCKRKGEGGNTAGGEADVAETVAGAGVAVRRLAVTSPPAPNKNTTPVISATRRVRDVDREDTMQHTPLKGLNTSANTRRAGRPGRMGNNYTQDALACDGDTQDADRRVTRNAQ